MEKFNSNTLWYKHVSRLSSGHKETIANQSINFQDAVVYADLSNHLVATWDNCVSSVGYIGDWVPGHRKKLKFLKCQPNEDSISIRSGAQIIIDGKSKL